MGRFISELRYFILKIITFIISKLCGTKEIIIFESSSDFCDNSKALFDYMIKNKLNKKYRMIWFVREDSTISKYTGKFDNVEFKKLKYSMNPLSKTLWTMIYYFSVAEYAFYSHDFIGGEGNKKQKRNYLGHGIMPLRNVCNYIGHPKHNTFHMYTSEFAAFYTIVCLNGGEKQARILGYPRNDQLFIKDKNVEKFISKGKYNKVIIWTPTFKHINNSSRNDYRAEVDKDISILTIDNIKKINKSLKANNTLLLIKFHPAQNMNYVSNFNMDNIKTISNSDLLEKEIDLYTLLGYCDAMITDFSSIYMDYLLVNKPIGFELGDKELYEKGTGFVFNNPLDYMPGNKIYNVEDFINFIKDVSNDNDKYKDEREKLLYKLHKNTDGNSAKRIVDFLEMNK